MVFWTFLMAFLTEWGLQPQLIKNRNVERGMKSLQPYLYRLSDKEPVTRVGHNFARIQTDKVCLSPSPVPQGQTTLPCCVNKQAP